MSYYNSEEHFNNFTIGKARRSIDRECKSMQFPMYIDRCKYLYNRFIDSSMITFKAFYLEHIYIKGNRDRVISDSLILSKYKSIKELSHYRVSKEQRDDYHLLNYFLDSFNSNYTTNKIIKALEVI